MVAYIIDGKGHLMGRLASICAKELLEGKKIAIVRCDKIEKSGKHIRSKLNFISRTKKRTNTNPKHGPFHFKTPSQVFWKAIRGMLPHKTFRGSDALMRLKLYDGIPKNLTNVKKLKVPCALRIVKLAPGRKYANLGEIFSEIGWTKKKDIDEDDEKFKTEGKRFWGKKYRLIQKRKKNVINHHTIWNTKILIE
jgi:large subunit ribosomal protein L13Ae